MAQGMGGPVQGRSMGRMKMLANLQMLRTDESLSGSLLVAAGTLFLLLAFTFYPLFLIVLLAAVSGAIAYKMPPLGTIAGMVFAFPAIAYQAPVLAWLFMVFISLALFEAWSYWSTISFLKIAILMPFAPFPFSLLSGFVYFALGVAALHFGSRHSFAVSLPAIFIVLLLSTVWMVQTSAFITISNDFESLYGPKADYLQNRNEAKPEVSIAAIVPEAGAAIGSLFSGDNIKFVSGAIDKVSGNAFRLIASDYAVFQLAVWAIALFALAFLPARFEHKYKQTISSLALLLVPIVNFAVAPSFGNPADPSSFIYCILSIGAIGLLESQGIKISGEKKALRQAKQKTFGKFGLQDLSDSEGVDSLGDVGGYADVKDELHEAIVAPIKQKELSYAYGIKPPTGILLFGPPGTGKTLLMKALAKELDIGFYYIKCSDLLSEWYGESEKNLAEVFAIARKSAPCVLFFDEIDSIGKRRDAYTSDDVAPRVMSVFLEELDGFKSKKNVITIGATNVPDQLDPALMRPGRFDKIIYMHLPDFEARTAIFRVHLSKLPTEEGMDYDRLAAKTERYSGADIKNICTEASRLAAREAMKAAVVMPVTLKHVLTVISKVKPSVSLDALESYEKFRMDYERRSGAEDKKPEEKGVRWDDVAGLDDVRTVLLESIEIPLLHEDLMKEMDVKPSKGLLLFGPPGCGKTMIVKAAANELNANFLTISGADLMKGKDRNPASYVKEIFNRARESAPALVFIDEIEALAPNRDEYRGGILNELLQELDGVKELKNVMLVGATNKPSALDPAILRPGRFDKIIYIPPPDEPARKQLFENNLAKFREKVDTGKLAAATDAFSGADIASVCQEVKMEMVRGKLRGKPIALGTEAVMKIISGRRPSITANDLKGYFAFMSEYGERR